MKKTLIIISIIVGTLLALQVRSFKKIEGLIQRAQSGSILSEVRIFQLANANLREQLEQREATLSVLNSTLANVAVEEEIHRLTLLSGDEKVSGEGIEITFTTAVEEFWINDLVAQLVSSSAEALSLNDIRVTPQNAGFRLVGSGFVLGSHFLKVPLRVSAIGPKDQLYAAVTQPGGIIDRIKNTHPQLSVRVTGADAIVIPALPQ